MIVEKTKLLNGSTNKWLNNYIVEMLNLLNDLNFKQQTSHYKLLRLRKSRIF